MNNKIFLNIASYRDPLLQYTINNIIRTAKNPENLVFGVCWQYGNEENEELDFQGLENRVLKIPYFESKGCSWARSLAFHLHKDEDFFWLLDSHMNFTKHWDESLIEQYYQTENEKSILSCAVSQWTPPDENYEWGGRENPKKAASRASNFWGSVLLQMFDERDITEKPELNSFLTACNLFGPKQWIYDVPYDPDMFFLGEEITLAVRSFTHGYNHYVTSKNMAYHKHDRGFRKEYSEDHYSNASRLTDVSIKRLETLFMMNNHGLEIGMYGLGDVRTVSQYEKYSGVDFKNKIISERAKTGRPDLAYL
jgi:hypothetical protein